MKYSISDGFSTENSVAYFYREKEEGIQAVVEKGKIETKKIKKNKEELRETQIMILAVSVIKEVMYHTENQTFYIWTAIIMLLSWILGIIWIFNQIEQRKFHGAEHQVFHWYKSGCKNHEKIKDYSRISPMCGTNIITAYMVMQLLTIVFFDEHISETLVILITNYTNKYPFPFALPGMLVQFLTTAKPDEMHIKVATKALEALVEEDE